MLDVIKVVNTALSNQLFTPTQGRKHNVFPELHLDPLHKWDIQDREKEKKRIATSIGVCVRACVCVCVHDEGDSDDEESVVGDAEERS